MFYVGSKFVAEVKISLKSFVVRDIIYFSITFLDATHSCDKMKLKYSKWTLNSYVFLHYDELDEFI